MIILIILLVIIDVISKVLAKHYLSKSIVIINHFFRLTYAENTGVAWSILDNNRVVVVILSGLIIAFLGYYLYKNKPKGKIEKITYGLIMAGAIGNFISRLCYGYVIDFIDIDVFGYNYPIFNLADIFIVVGVIWLIIDTWRRDLHAYKS